MNRKWAALGIAVSAALFLAGLSVAGDEDESPLHQLMEKVNSQNTTILKGVRSAVAYAKSQQDVAKAAEELAKLSKESKRLGDGPVKEQKKTIAEWNSLSDAFVAEAARFAALASKKDTTQVQAKDGYRAVSKSCTNCHEVFRVDE